MRVIAGTARGHTLKCPKGMKTRPTLDRVREAVFNVLGPRVYGAKFMDLFAGTGAIGIEALSRGAERCFFNEKDKRAYQIIKENLNHCNLESKAVVLNMDALDALKFILAEQKQSFNLVYLDPPYHEQLYDICFSNLSSDILEEEAIVIAETGAKINLQKQYYNLKLFKTGIYGDTKIWYYSKTND